LAIRINRGEQVEAAIYRERLAGVQSDRLKENLAPSSAYARIQRDCLTVDD
jgi:hypothetical protein